MAAKTFSISYMSFPVVATLGDALEVKMGLRTQRAPLEALRHLYVERTGDYQVLIVGYDKPEGTRGILRLFGNQGDSQFKALVDDLVAMKPSADLRAMPRREALKLMGARDTQLIAMVVVPIAVTALLFIGLSPFIIHSLDHGSQQVSAAELGKTKLTSHNLVVTGELDTERYLEVTNTKNGMKTSATFQFPVRAPDAPDDAFVTLVLKTNEMSGDAIDALARRGEWKCTLQDVLWEGMSSDDLAFMKDQLHLNVGSATQLCELSVGAQPSAAFMIGGVLCGGLFVSGIILLAIWKQRRKNA